MTSAARPRSLVAALLSIAVASASMPALGQSPTDKATATALFDEGKKLVKAGKFAEACSKFELSQKLDPGVGTLGSLANCYENAGRTASAWQAWRETAAEAAAKGQKDRETYARSKAAALEPKLSKLTIVVPSTSEVSGLEVRRDGVMVIRELWGSPTPVDPGTHTIEARAPGKKTFTTTVNVTGEGAAASVTIGPLEAETSETPVTTPTTVPNTATTTTTTTTTPTETPATTDSTNASTTVVTDTTTSNWSSQKTAALVVGGVGVVGIVVGSIFGLRAKSKNSDASAFCRPDDPTRCTGDGVSLSNDAHSAATISTVAFIAGGAALAGSAILWITAPKGASSSSSVGVGFGVANGGVGFSAQGAF